MGGTVTTRKNGNNFWQQKLVDHGISLHEMADMLGCSYKYTVAYFSGFVHPNEKTIIDICNHLDVPIEVGKLRFAEIYDVWGEEHKDAYVKYSNTYKKVGSVKGKAEQYLAAHSKPIRKAKTNFWLHKISGVGMNLQGVAEFLNVPFTVAKQYFTGVTLPEDDIIKSLCKKFNVDFSRAYREFVKIYTSKHPTPSTAVAEPSKEVVRVIDNYLKTPNIQDCLKAVYGELSYDDFMKATTLTTSYEDMLRFIYQKVDYSIFISLLP